MRVSCTALAAAVMAGLLSAPLSAAPIAVRVQNMDIEPNNDSGSPAVSADGKTIAFSSSATNLTPPGHGQLFSYSVLTDSIRSLTTNVDGGAAEVAVSANGRYIAFSTGDNEIGATDGECAGTNNGNDVLWVDTAAQPLVFKRVSRAAACSPTTPTTANNSSGYAAVSGDGRYVVFYSNATNLVTAPATTRAQIYEMDMVTRNIRLVTKTIGATPVEGSAAAVSPAQITISRDGTVLVFTTAAENLVAVNPGNNHDVIVQRIDRSTGAVSFESMNRNLVTGAHGSASSNWGSVSPNGRYVVFLSAADNLLPSGPSPSSFFVRDLVDNTLRAVPLPPQMGDCSRGRIDDNATAYLFCQPVQGAPSTAQQLFRITAQGQITLLSKSYLDGGLANGSTGSAFTVSADGRMLATVSNASNLAPGDTAGKADIYMIAEPEVFDELFRDGFE
jgi:Tol biopolymer transport system component